MTDDVNRLSVCLSATHNSSLEKCQFRSSAHDLIGPSVLVTFCWSPSPHPCLPRRSLQAEVGASLMSSLAPSQWAWGRAASGSGGGQNSCISNKSLGDADTVGLGTPL